MAIIKVDRTVLVAKIRKSKNWTNSTTGEIEFFWQFADGNGEVYGLKNLLFKGELVVGAKLRLTSIEKYDQNIQGMSWTIHEFDGMIKPQLAIPNDDRIDDLLSILHDAFFEIDKQMDGIAGTAWNAITPIFEKLKTIDVTGPSDPVPVVLKENVYVESDELPYRCERSHPLITKPNHVSMTASGEKISYIFEDPDSLTVSNEKMKIKASISKDVDKDVQFEITEIKESVPDVVYDNDVLENKIVSKSRSQKVKMLRQRIDEIESKKKIEMEEIPS